jgi:hypothetical protein
VITVVGTPNSDLQNMPPTFAPRIRFLHCPTQGVPVQAFKVTDKGHLSIALRDDKKRLSDDPLLYRHS